MESYLDKIRNNARFTALSVGGLVAALLALYAYKKKQKCRRMAGIEAGGTSFVIGIAEGSADNIIEKHRVFTKDPESTINELVDW